nr:MAG TPA: hypothetical protein [Caudoviricetes sp.]
MILEIKTLIRSIYFNVQMAPITVLLLTVAHLQKTLLLS